MKDKVVLITGAARGIGAAVATQLASRGARIALTGLEPEELAARASELGAGHMVRVADVTDADSIRQAAADVVTEFACLSRLSGTRRCPALELTEVLTAAPFPVVVGALLVAATQQSFVQRVVVRERRHAG